MTDVVRAQEGPTAVTNKLGCLLLVLINSLETNPVSHASMVISGVPTNLIINEKSDNILISSLCDFWQVVVSLVCFLHLIPFMMIAVSLVYHGNQIT